MTTKGFNLSNKKARLLGEKKILIKEKIQKIYIPCKQQGFNIFLEDFVICKKGLFRYSICKLREREFLNLKNAVFPYIFLEYLA